MTTTRLNWTGRRRIKQQDMDLVVVESKSGIGIEGTIDLSEFESGAVIIEVYRGQERYRAKLGHPTRSLSVKAEFPRFAAPSAILCEVKIVDENDGRILAASPRIRPRMGDQGPSKSLLPIDRRDLGELLWEIQLDDDQPIFYVNNRLPDPAAFVRTPEVARLVLPEVARVVARWLLDRLGGGADEDEPLLAQWVAFFRKLGCTDPQQLDPEDLQAAEDWSMDAARRFAAEHLFTSSWLTEADPE